MMTENDGSTSQKTNSEMMNIRARKLVWQRKIGPAFWTITGVMSLTVNIILIAALILLGRQLFTLKELVSDQLLNGLYENFVMMDDATIVTSVQVEDTIPVQFNLPVQTKTTVRLTKDTAINGAQVTINTPYLQINAPANIILPKGVDLPIALNINVPVDTTVPVVLNVPVNIPLDQTELHQPFVGLQNVIQPYNGLLASLPNSWEETPICGEHFGWVCSWLFSTP